MKICVRLFGHLIYNHQAIGDNGNQRVKCGKSGSYDKYLINCVGNVFTGVDYSSFISFIEVDSSGEARGFIAQ